MFRCVMLGLIFFCSYQLSFAACGVLCSCSVLAGGSVNFGSAFAPLQAGNTDTVGSFTLSCTALIQLNADYVVALSQGNSGSYAARTMLKGAVPLSYNLYTTAARTVVWGNGTAGTNTVTGSLPIVILTGTSQVINIYGRITGPQTALTPGGTYTDSITITVTY